MFGGTAKTYCQWKVVKAPYSKSGKYYVVVVNPKTRVEKEVRWYKDNEHDAMQQKTDLPEQPFIGRIFGFKDNKDHIYALLDRDTVHFGEETVLNDLGYKWRYGVFFGGCWYSPTLDKLPEVYHNYVKKVSWTQFAKSAAQAIDHGFWHSKEVLDSYEQG